MGKLVGNTDIAMFEKGKFFPFELSLLKISDKMKLFVMNFSSRKYTFYLDNLYHTTYLLYFH